MKKTILFLILLFSFVLFCLIVSADVDRLDYDSSYGVNRCIDGFGNYIVTGGDYSTELHIYEFDGRSLNLIYSNSSLTDVTIYGIDWYNESTIFAACGNKVHALYWNGVNITSNASFTPNATAIDVYFDDTNNTLFTAVLSSGISAHHFNGVSFTFKDIVDDGSSCYNVMKNTTGNGVWSTHRTGGVFYNKWNGSAFEAFTSSHDVYTIYDGLFVKDGICHVAVDDSGLACYRFVDDAVEHITNIDNGSGYVDVYVNDTYVFALLEGDLIVYTFDGSTYTFVDSSAGAGVSSGKRIFCDDTFIYVADNAINVATNVFIYVPIPNPPTGVDITYLGNNVQRINWTKNPSANNTLVVRKQGSSPSSYSDGTVVYNGTGSTYNFTMSETVYYYRLFSYSELHNGHAYSSTGANLPDGSINLNCYDANTSNNLTFDIFISNQDGSVVYNASNCVNTFTVNISEVPFGYDTQFIFSSDGYEDQIIYIDILNYGYYAANGFLSASNVSNLYFFQVVDEYNAPLNDVKVVVKQYINESFGYANISILYTDGYGYASCYLESDIRFKINASKDDYGFSLVDFNADPNYYGYYYPKIIKLLATVDDEPSYNFWDDIQFNGTKFNNGSIHIFYVDSLSNTLDATFYTYELNNFSKILEAINSTSSNTYDFWVTGIDINKSQQVILYLNHTDLGFIVQSKNFNPIISPILDENDIENKISAVFGSFDLGYVLFFFVYLPCIILLVIPSLLHPALGIFLSSLYLAFTKVLFDVPIEVLYNIIPVIMLLGCLLLLLKHGWKKL